MLLNCFLNLDNFVAKIEQANYIYYLYNIVNSLS